LSQLAGVAAVQDEIETAHELHDRARALAESSGNREALGWALALRGGTSHAERELEQAEQEFVEARRIFDEIGAAGRHWWATMRLAGVKYDQGDFDTAEELLRDAVRGLRATHEHGFLVEAERQLAETLLERGAVAEAEKLALDVRRRIGRGDVWTLASVRQALGLVRAAQGRREEAEAQLAEALAILEPTMYRRFAASVRDDLAELREGLTSPAQT
jgi:tetratricopeptide (TPR) repeat protein